MGLALALLATLGWGAGDVLSRKAAFHAPAGLVALVMTVVATVTLLTVVIITGDLALVAGGDTRFYVLVAIMGALSYAGGQFVYLLGMQRAGITIAAPIVGAVPLITVFLAVVFGGERPGISTLIGAFIIVSGIMLVVTDRNRVQT